MYTNKNELTQLYEILGHLHYLEGIINRNNYRKSCKDDELERSKEKINLDNANKKLNGLDTALVPFLQVGIFVICALFLFKLIRIIFAGAPYETRLVLYNAYSALSFMPMIILGLVDEFNLDVPFFKDESLEIGIAILMIAGYLNGVYITGFIVNEGGFWGIVCGLIWPIIQMLAFMFYLPLLIFGVTLIPDIGAVLVALLILLVVCIAFTYVWDTWVNGIIKHIVLTALEPIYIKRTKERDRCLEKYQEKCREINNKYVRQLELPKYSIGDVINKYRGILPSSDFTYATVSRIIWCIENRYANNIVGAKQWLAMQANNERIQQQLNNIKISQQRTYEMVQNTYAMANKAAVEAANASQKADEAKKIAASPVDVNLDITLNY